MTDEQIRLLREGKIQDLLNAYDDALAELFQECIPPEDHDGAMDVLNTHGLEALFAFIGVPEPVKH